MNLNLPLPWQQQQWQHLQHLVNSDRLPHALLFKGINGLGIFPLAKYFVQSLFCETQNNLKPCGSCKPCQLIINQTHPDFLQIETADNSSVIKIEQIRELTNFLCQTSEKNNYRVILIKDAEKMHRSAANALLKTLEEPILANAVLILVSTAPDNLLATIRSRCQSIHFATPKLAIAKNWLRTHLSENDDFDDILYLANNAPLQILEWQQSNKLDSIKSLITDLNNGSNLALAKKWQHEDSLFILDLLINEYAAMLKKLIFRKEKINFSQENIFKKLDCLYEIKRNCNNNINLNKQLMLEKIFAN